MKRATGRFFAAIALVLLIACGGVESPSASPRELMTTAPQRIISLAPSITETLFALGLGDRVVGVTRYCNYPESAKNKTRIGGYYNPNYEAVVTLNPDLVILLNEHQKERGELEKLGIPYLMLDNRNVASIFQAIRLIGETCEVTTQAESLIDDLESRIRAVRLKTAETSKQRVMVSIGRNMGTATLKDVYLAGPGTLYHELINIAGGQNVIVSAARAYPIVSPEGMIELQPQVILDMVSDLDENQKQKSELEAEWQSLGDQVPAVRDHRVHILSGDYVTVPGPRFILLLEDMAQCIHPEHDRSEP